MRLQIWRKTLNRDRVGLIFGSSGKFVLFIGWTDMLVGHGRDIVTRDFWCFQELLFYQDGDQTRWRICGGRAFAQTVLLSGVPKPRGDSQGPTRPAGADVADWFSSGLFGGPSATLPMQTLSVHF
jgi:hypothetical protein